MYSLGAVIYAVHCKGKPPFHNHGSLGTLRDNAGRAVPDIGNLDVDLQGIYLSSSFHLPEPDIKHIETSYGRSLREVRKVGQLRPLFPPTPFSPRSQSRL